MIKILSNVEFFSKRLFFFYRQCDSTQVFVKEYLTHCIDECKSETMCGEVIVPEEHLDVNI